MSLFAKTLYFRTFVLVYHICNFYTYSKEPTAMNNNIQLNDHNKAEYPPMHNGEFDTSQTYNHR